MKKKEWLFSADVLRVVDGDTIEVSIDVGFGWRSRQMLRLYGVNTAELNSKDPVKRGLANDARVYLDSVLGGKTVITETIKPHDKYGRYLAKVFLEDGTCVNDKLVELKLAEVLTY